MNKTINISLWGLDFEVHCITTIEPLNDYYDIELGYVLHNGDDVLTDECVSDLGLDMIADEFDDCIKAAVLERVMKEKGYVAYN